MSQPVRGHGPRQRVPQVIARVIQPGRIQGDLAVEAWTEWAAFPDPRKKEFLYAPMGPGVYELRWKDTGELVLHGSGKNCAYRMTSLLPATLGQGSRKNQGKRDYVMENLTQLEYRCCACDTEAEARSVEARLKLDATYRFPT